MHFLITAGGTREYIDPIRFISNSSSGKMGHALAAAAMKAGHKVTLISASDLQPAVGIDFVGVDSAGEMFTAVKKFFAKADCLIMSAAVSDYTPVKVSKTKIKKGSGNLNIELKPTTDILAWAGRHKKKNQFLVGFALEDKDIRERAEQKLKQKNLDMIIANKPSAIGAAKTTVHIKMTDCNWVKLTDSTKTQIAKEITSLIAETKG